MWQATPTSGRGQFSAHPPKSTLPNSSEGKCKRLSAPPAFRVDGSTKHYQPRKLQSMGYDGPIEISKYQKFQYVREMLQKDGINIPLPTGN